MDAIKKIIFLIIPITLLLCFIAYGISVVIPGENVTYLIKGTREIESTGQIITYYTFDFKSYVFNLDMSYLKKIVADTFDTEELMKSIESFQLIWQDGYDLGDIVKTIAASFIVVFNFLILLTNILLLLPRFIFAILLTAFSLLGINISNPDLTLVNIFKFIVNDLKIPMIPAIS